MNTRLVVYPSKPGFKSAKKLTEALDAIQIKTGEESTYQPKNGDFIIDYGNGYKPEWASALKGKNIVLLNHWDNVCLSVSKTATFKRLHENGVPHPEWTFNSTQAQLWLNQGYWVCCRHNDEGKDGDGLFLAKKSSEFQHAKFYTKYKPIFKEFRVYVLGNELIDVREKRRDTDLLSAGKINPDIRTTSGGWVFCEHGFTVPKDALPVAVAANKALGLDFSGVDVIQAKEDNKCYILETNTAPYLGDHTVAKFAKAIQKLQKEFITKTW